MAELSAEIEALTLGLLRAWVAGDAKAAKKLIARDGMMMIGSSPPQLLDRPSFLSAMERGFACRKFALREVFVRSHGKSAWIAAGVELDLLAGRHAWAGSFLLTGLWRRGSLARSFALVELGLARLEEPAHLAETVRSMQLWK